MNISLPINKSVQYYFLMILREGPFPNSALLALKAPFQEVEGEIKQDLGCKWMTIIKGKNSENTDLGVELQVLQVHE